MLGLNSLWGCTKGLGKPTRRDEVRGSPTRGLRAYVLKVGLLLTTMIGCSSAPQVGHYGGEQPALDLARYFNGHVTAHGVFRDRSGKVVRRFKVEVDGHWQGPPNAQTGVLDERFTYLNEAQAGQTQRRVWTLVQQPAEPGHKTVRYIGTADDVLGQAHGEVAGNALRWSYTLKLPVDGSVYEVQFDDWMFLVDERVMLNHAVMSKWGVYLGDVQIAFTKSSSP